LVAGPRSLPSAFFQPPVAEGALGPIGREARGVGSETVEMMQLDQHDGGDGGGGAEKDDTALYFIRSLNSSAVKSASFRMLFRIFGWRIFFE